MAEWQRGSVAAWVRVESPRKTGDTCRQLCRTLLGPDVLCKRLRDLACICVGAGSCRVVVVQDSSWVLLIQTPGKSCWDRGGGGAPRFPCRISQDDENIQGSQKPIYLFLATESLSLFSAGSFVPRGQSTLPVKDKCPEVPLSSPKAGEKRKEAKSCLADRLVPNLAILLSVTNSLEAISSSDRI